MAKSKLTADEAREFSNSLAKAATGDYELMDIAINTLGVPAALGMETAEWVDSIGGYMRMSVEDRRTAVQELLLTEKKSIAQTATILGISRKTVERDRDVLNATSVAPPAQIEAGSATSVPLKGAELKEAIRAQIDEGKTDAQIAASLGGDPSNVARHRRTYKREQEEHAKKMAKLTPAKRGPAPLTEAEAHAMLDGRLAQIELAALNLAAWWLQQGKAALAEDDGWVGENITHTKEKVGMILDSVRGVDTDDADAALARWAAEAEAEGSDS